MSKSDRFIQTYGFNALKRTLDNMSKQGQKKVLMPALKRAVKGTLEMSRMTVPKGKTHNLANSLAIKASTGETAVIVGAWKGGNYKGWHGHLLNDGTVTRSYIAKKTVHFIRKDTRQWFSIKAGSRVVTGKMKTTGSYFGWFTRAVNATEASAVNKLSVEWQKGVMRCIIRNTKAYDSKDN
jgi:hypothetical protein